MMKPHEIEQQSFAIIDAEAGSHGFDPAQWRIVRRMIHTTADFEYMKSTRFHQGAVEAGIRAIRGGCTIFTDTDMVRTGIRRRELVRFGGEVLCLMGSAEIATVAEAAGTTRAATAVDAVADRLTGAIYAIGNAPTALLRLIERIRLGKARPALVIGLPVGFVNAVESKSELLTTEVAFITNIGRKGGSNVAAAVVNALILLADEID